MSKKDLRDDLEALIKEWSRDAKTYNYFDCGRVMGLGDAAYALVLVLNEDELRDQWEDKDRDMKSYAAVVSRYGLRAAERTQLDNAAEYREIMDAAYNKNWLDVFSLLISAGILS